jgi:hypothetical protein
VIRVVVRARIPGMVDRSRSRAALALLLVLAAVAGAGCDDESPKSSARDRSPSPGSQATRALPRDVAVIRAWSETVSRGRVDEAARFFSRPAIVENNSPPIRLETPTALKVFNRSLPCGAKLLEARRAGRYTVATFKLTERPGGDCRNGTGHKAATAFTFRGGKISEWRRTAVPGEAEPAPEPDPGAPPPEQA